MFPNASRAAQAARGARRSQGPGGARVGSQGRARRSQELGGAKYASQEEPGGAPEGSRGAVRRSQGGARTSLGARICFVFFEFVNIFIVFVRFCFGIC